MVEGTVLRVWASLQKLWNSLKDLSKNSGKGPMAAEVGGGGESEAGTGRAGDHCNTSGDREYEAE